MHWANLIADGGVTWRSNCCFAPLLLALPAAAGGAAAAGAGTAAAAGGAAAAAGSLSAIGALTDATMAASALGGAASAAGMLASGRAAKQAGDMTQTMDKQNASQALASGQRKMFDTQDKARMLESTAASRAGGSGVDAGIGSPASTVGDIAQRGSYHALMDMFNGQSEAVGLQNQGNMAEWEGNQKKTESELSAAGTLAGSAGSMFQQYGKYNFPGRFNRY